LHAAERPFLIARDVQPAVQSGGSGSPQLNAAESSALGYRDVHIHLHGVPAGEQAAVIRQALEGRN
jgi:hypothetical protein